MTSMGHSEPDALHTRGRLLLLEKNCEKLKSSLKKKESVIAALKERLSSENAQHTAMENKVLTLIRDIKAKWKKEEEARLAQVQEECGLYKEALSKEHAEAMEKTVQLHELQQQHSTLQQQLQHCKRQAVAKDKEIVKLQQQISDLQNDLSAARVESKQSESVLHASSTAAELALLHSQLTSVSEERDSMRDKVKLLEIECDKIATLENELKSMRELLEDTETKSFEDMQRFTQAHDKALSTKEALVRELQSNLVAERREKTGLASQLQSLDLLLQEARSCQAKVASELQEVQEAKHEELQEVRKQLDEAQHCIKEKERQAELMHKTLEESQKRSAELELAVHKQEQSSAERQSSSELQSLAEQLSRAREASARAEENARNLSEQLEKEQTEASRLRLDVKLTQRELKSAQEKIEFLRECARENRETIKQGQAAVKERDDEVQKLQQRIVELEDQLAAGQERVQAQEVQHKEEVSQLQGRITALQETVSSGSKVSAQLSAARAEIDQLRLSKRGTESRLEATQQEVKQAEDKVTQLQLQLADRDQQIVKLNEGTTLLKDLCSEQDAQLTQLETFEERLELQRQERSKFEEQITRLQSDLKAARAQANEEKSLKVFQERKVKGLQDQLQEQERQHDQILAALHQEADQTQTQNTKLATRISELEKQVYEAECSLQAMEESAEGMKTQLELLKEETQGHIKHIHALKESNFQLTQGLEEAVDKGHLYKRKVEELGGKLEEERQVTRDKDMRNKMTTEQHTKLIDFLHAKLDDKTKKKKTLSSKLFGGGRGKENQDLTPYKTRSQLLAGRDDPIKCTMESPHPAPVSVEQCRLLKTPSSTLPPPPKTPTSAALHRQQSSSLKVPSHLRKPVSSSHFKTSKDQLFKTPSKDQQFKTPSSKDPSKTPSSKDLFKTPSKAYPSSHATHIQTPASGTQRDHSQQRIRHNIPHRFERSMVVQGGRCSGCLSSVPRGRFAYRCSHCSLLAHKHCCPGVPPTCGLPQELAMHFAAEQEGSGSSTAASVVHEGWVKIPKASKACWEFCFARLLSSGDLLVFDHEPSDAGDCSLTTPSSALPAAHAPELQPTSTICLCPVSCRTEVISAVPRSEIPATSTIDLPYVLKVDVVRGYQQSVQRLYIMTTNFEQKQRWVAALELTVKRCSDVVSITDDGTGRVQVQHLLQLHAAASAGHEPSPNSVIFIDPSVCLLGCSEGVLSCSVSADGELTKKALLGTLTSVHQLLDIPSIAHVAAIAGVERGLYLLQHRSLLTAATHCTVDEPAVSHEAVSGLAGVKCHLLATGVTSSGVTFVCAAAEDRISILSWDSTSNQLQVVRQYGTQEACTSCLFTPAALIVAADKLYEIDLTSFSIEEFLDESDTSLAYAVYGTAHLSSYPLAILQVSESGKYGEFLVCFNEFALFVDPYGQRSREHDIKFTRVPVAIEYCKGNLYLLHSNSVEVLHICSDSFTKVTTSSHSSQEFDSSSIGPTCASASLTLSRPSLLGRRNESIVVRCDGEAGTCDVLQLTGNFPSDDLTCSWSSLPSAITAPHSDGPDSTSASSGVYSLGDGDQLAASQQPPAERQRGDKRKQDGSKQVTFSANSISAAAITKRSKRDIAQ
ncbi:Protein kinase C-like phorbol ester/diacylglycerol-binding domain [Trinorchestia longiramus]|nr:Protein kinase C-like phorbol ester/diacylglycerol-binding domain [Trinorchestia longiramus]